MQARRQKGYTNSKNKGKNEGKHELMGVNFEGAAKYANTNLFGWDQTRDASRFQWHVPTEVSSLLFFRQQKHKNTRTHTRIQTVVADR